jgi:mono/diheme cytochrome c family protein
MHISFVFIMAIATGFIVACSDDATDPHASNSETVDVVLSQTDVPPVSNNESEPENTQITEVLTRKPQEAVADTPKGELKNPYEPNDKEIAELGHKTFMKYGCNGCHGGTGGGGMGPPLTNQRWVYGNDPDTLFRLVAMGSQYLLDNGYSRIARENVVGPMPVQAHVQTEDDLWKIITWIQSLHLESD